jgi:hypothetical protein
VKVFAVSGGIDYNIAKSDVAGTLKTADFTPGTIDSFSFAAVQTNEVFENT